MTLSVVYMCQNTGHKTGVFYVSLSQKMFSINFYNSHFKMSKMQMWKN